MLRKFLRRSGVEGSLGSDGAWCLIDRLDPRGTGYIRYVKFLDNVRVRFLLRRSVG